MGLAAYDSGDDDEADTKNYYILNWRPGEGVRLHTIERSTGLARIWELPHTFLAMYACNAFDTEGARWRLLCCTFAL